MAMGIWAEFVYGTEAGYHTLPVDVWLAVCWGDFPVSPRPLDAEVPICRDVFLEVFCPAGQYSGLCQYHCLICQSFLAFSPSP